MPPLELNLIPSNISDVQGMPQSTPATMPPAPPQKVPLPRNDLQDTIDLNFQIIRRKMVRLHGQDLPSEAEKEQVYRKYINNPNTIRGNNSDLLKQQDRSIIEGQIRNWEAMKIHAHPSMYPEIDAAIAKKKSLLNQ